MLRKEAMPQMARQVGRVFSESKWHRLALAFMLVIAPIFLFVELADEVRDNDTIRFDESVLQMVNGISSPFLDLFMVGLTQLGGIAGAMTLTAGGATLLWVRRKRQKAVILVAGVSGAAVLNILLKAAFQRDRPELWERIVTEHSFSFPSGHAMGSSALAFSLIVIFWQTRWRWLVVSLAVLYMASIGFTRLYLGVHYPTDVLAGWIVSAAWIVALVSAIYYRRWFLQSKPKSSR